MLVALNKKSAQNKNDIATTASRKPLFHKRNNLYFKTKSQQKIN